jgi:hypothetical protein
MNYSNSKVMAITLPQLNDNLVRAICRAFKLGLAKCRFIVIARFAMVTIFYNNARERGSLNLMGLFAESIGNHFVWIIVMRPYKWHKKCNLNDIFKDTIMGISISLSDI